jgi:hypothetical protein
MRFALLAIVLAILAALLVWAWATDFVLVRQCRSTGGIWNADDRTCHIRLNPGPEGLASRRP